MSRSSILVTPSNKYQNSVNYIVEEIIKWTCKVAPKKIPLKKWFYIIQLATNNRKI